MDFSLNDEQAMLKESIVQYLAKSYSFDERMLTVRGDQPYSKEQWQQFADLGWLSLPFSEDDDGFGGGPVEMMLLMQELGKHLVVEPYLATIILAGGCVAASANAAVRGELLSKVMSGEAQLALAYAEPQSRFELADIRTTAHKDGSHYRLNGEKILVLNGASCEQIVVAARTNGEPNDTEGITLFCVDSGTEGITRHGYKTVDGFHGANICFDNVRVSENQMLSVIDQGFNLLNQVVLDATLAVSAEALGIIETLTYKTVDYTKEREQFGVPLSSFQALQHRMVDMFMELEQARSLLLRATIKRQENAPDTAQAIAALKYYIGTAGRKVGEEAVQFHGGMGVTDEMDVAHFFKRLTVIDTLFGNSDYQLEMYLASSVE